jgi:hypothetical protein
MNSNRRPVNPNPSQRFVESIGPGTVLHRRATRYRSGYARTASSIAVALCATALVTGGCDSAPAVPTAPEPENVVSAQTAFAEHQKPEANQPSADQPKAAINREIGATPADTQAESIVPKGEHDHATATGSGVARRSHMAGIEIDRPNREVRVSVRTAMNAGILEFLAVAEGGRVHESVFSAQVRPSILHLSLLMIGLEPCGPVRDDVGWYERARKSSARLKVEVECEQEGETVRVPVSELLHNREAEDGIAPDTWVFAGSYFMAREGKQQYAGDLHDAIVSIAPSSTSVVQYATQTSNPYAGEKFGLALGSHDIGPVGTQVTLVFSPWDRTGGEPAEK